MSERPVLLLLASLAATHQMWQLQLPAWSRHFEIVAWDYHGHGNALDPAAMDSVDAIAHCLLAELDRRGVDRFHIAGISLGGMVALQLARQAPQRVRRIVASHCRYHQTPELQAAWDDRIALARRAGMSALESATIERWIAPAVGEAFPQRVALIRSMVNAVSPASYAACAAAVRDFDARAWVDGLSAPMLLLAGSADVAAPAEHVQALAGRIAGARFMGIEGGRHVPALDTPERYTRLVEDFLLA